MSLSFGRVDLAQRQLAFTGLLAHPQVAPWLNPALYALVTRYEKDLDTWCKRLGYRLVRIDSCVRLRRVPLADGVAVPGGPIPARRRLVLALLAAAVLEDVRADSVTLQEISDSIRRFAAVNDLSPYDPETRSHRVDLVEGVRLLLAHGVLEQRTHREELLGDWQRAGQGIGAGYLIHRDALVLMLNTTDAELALAPVPDGEDQRRARILRRLVETQALYPADLSDDDRSYLTSQRTRLIDQAEEMTGGTVEVRSDAWMLILPSDHDLDPELFVGFPAATAADWISLALLDALVHTAEVLDGGRRLARCDQIRSAAASLNSEHGTRLTVALRESPEAIIQTVDSQLRAASLIQSTPEGDWVLLPAAGRYRAALLGTAPVDPAEPAEVALW
jgi:hypothetical protein